MRGTVAEWLKQSSRVLEIACARNFSENISIYPEGNAYPGVFRVGESYDSVEEEWQPLQSHRSWYKLTL